MPNRLGNVLYWTGCIAAVLWLSLILYFVQPGNPDATMPSILVIVFAIISWTIGRAFKYVLTGR